MEVHEFVAEMWLWPGDAAWHFVTLPTDVADDLDASVPDRAGFGSVPVEVTVGSTTWKTSVFPDKKAASFVLPIKQLVRRREAVVAGDDLVIRLTVDVERLGRGR